MSLHATRRLSRPGTVSPSRHTLGESEKHTVCQPPQSDRGEGVCVKRPAHVVVRRTEVLRLLPRPDCERVKLFRDAWPPRARLAPTGTCDGNRRPETRFRVVRSTDVPAMNPPTDPPPGLIAVPVPKAVLLLTQAAFVRGLKRRKWSKRMEGAFTREAEASTPQTPRAPEGGGTDARRALLS